MVKSKKINVVGVEVLKKNGLDVDKLIKLLVTNASVEFTAYYYFTNLRMHCTGLDGEGVKGIIEDARLEDLSHFESCIERIFQLGGSLPNDAQAFIKMTGCEFLQLPKNPTDMKAILEKCLKAEQGAIVNWNKVCKMTFDKDKIYNDSEKWVEQNKKDLYKENRQICTSKNGDRCWAEKKTKTKPAGILPTALRFKTTQTHKISIIYKKNSKVKYVFFKIF